MRWLVNIWWRLIRFGFRLLYYELAFTYDAVSWVVSLGQWRCWQRSVFEFLPQPDHSPILEVAHGTGNLQLDLYHKGYVSYGLDLSPQMGKIAYAKLSKQNVPVNLIQGRAQLLPFPCQLFDAVVITFPTNFIAGESVMQEIFRVLRNDGVLIVVLSSVFKRDGYLQRLLEVLYRITGQRVSDCKGQAFYDSFLNQMKTNGFVAKLHEVPCKSSKAIVMVARKSFFPSFE